MDSCNTVSESNLCAGKDLVDKYPEKPEAHKWYAICVVEFQKQKGSTKEEIKGGFMFYKHATKALELDDSDPSVHYMMGKFCFAVAKLSYFERKVCQPNLYFNKRET